jgi:2,3-bisphosphoglycerate-dependent phosphoglycerate mutase
VERDEVSGEFRGLPGNSRSYLEKRFPEFKFPEGITAEGWWMRPFETEMERSHRAMRVLGEIVDRHATTKDHVALVSHAAFYSHFLKAAFGIVKGDLFFSLANTAITRIDFEEHEGKNYQVVRYMNRVDFLPVDLVTL